MTKLYFFDTNIISHMMRETTGLAAQRFTVTAKANTFTKMATSVIVHDVRPEHRVPSTFDSAAPRCLRSTGREWSGRSVARTCSAKVTA